MVFQSLDSLYHLNLSGLKKMIQGIETSVPKLVEIVNFEKYGLVLAENASQN